jgi:hypothetical protein
VIKATVFTNIELASPSSPVRRSGGKCDVPDAYIFKEIQWGQSWRHRTLLLVANVFSLIQTWRQSSRPWIHLRPARIVTYVSSLRMVKKLKGTFGRSVQCYDGINSIQYWHTLRLVLAYFPWSFGPYLVSSYRPPAVSYHPNNYTRRR